MLKTEVIGRIGKDAEVKMIGQNKVVNFNVAHSQRGTDANGQKTEATVWVSCAKFMPAASEAKIADYLRKGTPVYVRGDLSVREYDAKDGQRQFALNLRVAEIELLPSTQNAGASGEVPPQDETMPV